MRKNTTTSLREYTDEEIRNALNNSRNYAELARLLNCQKKNSVSQKKNVFHYLNQIGIYDLTIKEMKDNYDEVHFGNHHCLNCGKVLDPKLVKQGNKFCSKSCAGTYNNTGRKHSEESKEHLKETQKTSEKVRKAIIKRFYNGDEELYNKVQEEKKLKSEKPKRILNKLNITKEKKPRIKKEKVEKPKYCKICGRELVNGKCPNDFCIKLSKSKIFEILITYFGFDSKKMGTIEVESEFNRIKLMLIDMYWNKHMSSTEICSQFKYPNIENLTRTVFKRMGIVSKTPKQATIENIEMKRMNNIPFTNIIKHISWNNKKMLLRSYYEEDYAIYLDKNQILYEVETLKIKYYDSQRKIMRFAIPDFYLVETNTIVEIKSYWTLDLINMIDKVKEYKKLGYNFKLILEHKETDIFSLLDLKIIKSPNMSHAYL